MRSVRLPNNAGGRAQSLNKRRENTPPFSKPTFFHEWKEHGIIYHLVWSKSEYLNPKGLNHPVFEKPINGEFGRFFNILNLKRENSSFTKSYLTKVTKRPD